MKTRWLGPVLAGALLGAAAWLPAQAAGAAVDQRLISPQQARELAGKEWGASAAGQYLAGRLAQSERDYGSAADYLEGALSWDPNNLDLRRRVFLLMLAEGRLADALPHAYPLARDGSDPMLPAIAQAAAAMREGDYEAALKHFGTLDNAGVAGLIRLLGQAWALVGKGDIAAARASLGFSADQAQWRGLIGVHQALIEDVGGGGAAAAYSALARNDDVKSARAAALFENFRVRQSDSSVEPLVATAEDGLGEAFFSIAAALNQGDRDLSALIYGQIGLNIAPDNDLLRLLVAEVIAGQGRYEDAAAMFATIPEGSPYRYDAQIARARNLARADMADEAVSVLRNLSAADPSKAEAASLLGDVLRGEARFDEAVAAYDEAAARIGEMTADHWRLLYSRGIALERSGKWARAESDLRAALAFNEDEAYILNYLGYSWIDRGENLEQAEQMVRCAAELRPQDGFIADSLGWVYYRTGRYAEAVAELERAVTLEPLDPVINEHLGDAYWQVGRKTEARFQWRRALNLEPEADLIPVLEEKLRCGVDRCAMAGKTD